MKLPGIVCAVLTLSFCSVTLAEEVNISTVEHGIFTLPEHKLAPGERLVNSSDRVISETTTIPARLGVRFGLRFKLTDVSYLAKPQIKFLYLAPGINDVESHKRLDKIEIVQAPAAESPYHQMAFEFTDSAELIPGEWHFYVFHEDRKLAEQSFQVVAE